jgi:hypothetical protein
MAKLNIAKLNALCSKNIFVLLLIIGVLLVVILALLIDTRVKEKFTSDATGEKMVLYHLNGCHHCTKLMPVWNELKKTHGAHMAEYEATAHPELMKHHNITSFPTIMKGKHVFKGERTHDNLKAFLMNQTGGGLSGGAIVGIVFGIILIVGFIWFKTNSGRPLNEAELAAGVMEKQDWGGSSPQIK